MDFACRALLIEDDLIFRTQLERALHTLQLTTVSTYEDAHAIIQKQSFDLVLLDRVLPNHQDGTNLIPQIKLLHPQTVIIVLTAQALDSSVLEALRMGAADYLQKTPSITTDLLGRITVAFNRLSLERRLVKAESLASDRFNLQLIGKSESTIHLRETIQTIASSEINILISGETGTGKELIARALNLGHQDKARPIVFVNCGAISSSLVESELFGHVKGAFTGATSDKKGKVELANGGDLFLDEIGDIPQDVQVKLLRVLQDGEFFRVGCHKIRHSKFRVIAATNKHLPELIKNKTFRNDLYYRITTYEITTTPLRERIEDIPDIVEYFIRNKVGSTFSISSDSLKYLQQQSWPGNVRELLAKVEAAVIFTKKRNSNEIIPADFLSVKKKTYELKPAVLQSLSGVPKFQFNENEYRAYSEEMDKNYIRYALDHYNWDLEKTAVNLGISRSKMYQRVLRYGLKNNKKIHRIMETNHE